MTSYFDLSYASRNAAQKKLLRFKKHFNKRTEKVVFHYPTNYNVSRIIIAITFNKDPFAGGAALIRRARRLIVLIKSDEKCFLFLLKSSFRSQDM